jgi:type 1 glutamine amidotransferase
MKLKIKNSIPLKWILPITACIFIIALFTYSTTPLRSAKPLKILLVTGGCCHNYDFQTEVIKTALPASLKVEWTVLNEGGTGTTAQLDFYNNKNWAKGYDLVVHNECFADTQDSAYIKKITNAHQKGVNAVVIHCAMHSYRAAAINDWREFLGVTTRRHDHQSQYPVKVVCPEHEVMRGFPAVWMSAKDELYIIEKLWPSARVLLTSVSESDGKTYPVAWTNQYGKARIFGTTFGHSDETFKDTLFVKLLGQGMMWAMDKN